MFVLMVIERLNKKDEFVLHGVKHIELHHTK